MQLVHVDGPMPSAATMAAMDQTCPRCGSDAAVTWSSAGDGTEYTCRFSHGGQGPVSWIVPATTRPAARTRAGSRTAAPRAPKAPAAARGQSRSAAGDAPVSAPAPRLTVNDRGIAAVVEEVTRRGGRARVEQAGTTREVVVTGEDYDGEVRLLVRARTAGDWHTRASYGEPRAEDEHPAAFWVLVHLSPGTAQCYVVPDWWMRNDIYDKHEDYLRSHRGTGALSPDSDHHAIRTERVAQWLGRWDQLRVLPPGQA